jgi:hypothetical protein
VYSLEEIVAEARKPKGSRAFCISTHMKTYHLQKEPSGRLFIDTKKHRGCEKLKSCEAASWQEAKEKLTKPA